jgi:hypothetical protein
VASTYCASISSKEASCQHTLVQIVAEDNVPHGCRQRRLQCAQLQALIARQVAGILRGDAAMLGHALDSDAIVEPVRGPLIPGFR